MLKQQTVFVLGAGSSYPYGLPLGSELSASICTSETITALSQGSSAHGPVDVKTFIRAFEKSGQPSIDAFLERRSHFDEIGKRAIAYYLCTKEKPEKLFSYDTTDNWYRALWREMTVDCGTIDSAAARVSFVTFNYDRSLEHFLFTAGKNTFDKVDDERALQFVKKIPIVHAYGSLGEFDYRLDPAFGRRPYEATNDPMHLSIAANGIRIIPEGRTNGKPFEAARKLLEHAETICFLGFGFDQANIDRLNLASVLLYSKERERPMPRIVISRLGKTNRQVTQILQELCPALGTVEHYDKTNLATLAEAGLIR